MIVLWRVSNHCNLACPFCAYDKRLRLPRAEADPAQVARFIDVLGTWQRETGEVALLSWLGGEPLLWAPRSDLDALAARRGIALSLTTNGTLLGAPRVRAELVERYAEVTISVDGPAAVHDRLRGWPGAFAKLSRSVPALVAARDAAAACLKIRVNVVLMHDTVADFPALCDTLAGWGVDEISFNQLGGRDRPEFFPAHRLRPADVTRLAAALPPLRARLAERGTTLVGGGAYLARIADTVAGRPLPVDDCRVADTFLFVDEAGRVAPCSFAPEHWDIHVDALGTPAALSAVPRRLRAHQRTRPAADCADCPSTQQFAKFAA